MYFFSIEFKPMPEIDLIFALSATAANAPQNFQKMKEIIKRVIREYGKRRVHYSIVTYGNPPQIKLRFVNSITKDQTLERFVDTLTINGRGRDLSEALRTAQGLFDEAETIRSGAKKVLVVISDKRSGIGKLLSSFRRKMHDFLQGVVQVPRERGCTP